MVNAPRRLRIAYVVHDYNRHVGHRRYVVELASRYRHAHSITVFTNSVEVPDATGITFRHIPCIRSHALVKILTFVVPATLLTRGDFDIVHAQGLCGLNHTLATAHFCQSAWFDALAKEGLQLTLQQQIFRALVTPLERRALVRPGTRRVIAVAGRVKDDLERFYGRTSGVDVIYHGTDAVTLHPDNRERYRASVRASIGISDDRFVALYVGDLKKGVVAAIRAVARTPGVTLLVVSFSDAAPYHAVVEREGVKDRVIFHPHSKQIERFFASVDAFVFPTVYDPYGLVISEAMATGIPVVTSRAAGAAELITHEENGLLTNSAWDCDKISQQLAKLRDDRALRERLEVRARARIEPLTWDRTAEQTMAVYESMVGR